MGFHYGNSYVQGMVAPLPVLTALTTCVSRIRAGQASAALFRWFGDNSPAWTQDALRRVDKMRSVLNLQNITLGFEWLSMRGATTNAAAFPNSVPNINPTSLVNTSQGMQVNLDEGFNRLPNYLGLTATRIVDTTGYHQSKLNTVLHELSHAILGTVDAPNGACYGAQNARQLATNNSTAAKLNAENWGIFVEACGHHKAS
jgi:hypothetical protein